MASPVPNEERLLAPAKDALDAVLGEERQLSLPLRLEVLEAVAADIGGFDLDAFRALSEESYNLLAAEARQLAVPVAEALATVPIAEAPALTALAREPLTRTAQRKAGAYYTDFRLARHLAANAAHAVRSSDLVIDPASGTGILLAAVAVELKGRGEDVDVFLRQGVHAADLSANALRGVRLSLASLTADVEVIRAFSSRLRATDSLVAGPEAWLDCAPNGFDLVIGNPPWEKLKVTRHEHLLEEGISRHYGSDYAGMDLESLEDSRRRMATYADEVKEIYEGLQGGGEIDLYHLFLSLSIHLLTPGGQIAMLLPAGLIRSQGTRELRKHLLDVFPQVNAGVCFNHAKFFAIDTRFKFLALHAVAARNGEQRLPVVLDHLEGTDDGVERAGRARLGRAELRRIRPDLSVPEVRSPEEWTLFRRLSETGVTPAKNSGWDLQIVREVDMTRDRDLFERKSTVGSVPLIEGRMVHQFRHCAKRFVSGSGRSAKWDTCQRGSSDFSPQFWVNVDAAPAAIRERVQRERVGFCDIAGQTNERAMLAARIPAGVVCGNKVPTIEFAESDQAAIWLAVANSFAFDWLLRRVLTTTVNYFLLRSVPLPQMDGGSAAAAIIVDLVQQIDDAYHGVRPRTDEEVSVLRAEVDARVMLAYGLAPDEVPLIFADFPLIDRGQPPLPGEQRSTITEDFVLASFLSQVGDSSGQSVAEDRANAARAAGARAYIPAEVERAHRKREFGLV